MSFCIKYIILPGKQQTVAGYINAAPGMQLNFRLRHFAMLQYQTFASS
jgi:hypothetical protein